ncbi:putative YkwD family protein [Paenibacillus endophyticus]|uniref:Putative YkwD family protein n=1 Tax=Paenibacillus endophyticus TaxID=1294268 RepID=A0A7W5G965_9BACL|nr:CAP domain-containing protein [Paenibacillus endophyticus]MBB3151331.1 putative YkwD family protein [Paenibacillus endophyticus]
MKKFVAIAALLVVTGCSSGSNMMHKQSAHEYAKDKAPLITAAPHVTRASSVATTMPGRPSGTLRGSQFTFPDWLFGDGTGIQNPTNPTTQYPVTKQPTTQNPTTQNPGTQAPATQNPSGEKAATGQFEQQVLQIVNAERSKAGLGALSMDSKLANMAMVKAKDMSDNNYFDHNSPTYGSPFDMMRQFQITYSSAGENIAKGQPTAERVMNDWMNSPGHRANILNGSFSKIGVAYYNGSWVQEFIG